jgi:rRNA-processing protein Efg1
MTDDLCLLNSYSERQKVLRKINQTKREIEKSRGDSGAEVRLYELRVDLNYILVCGVAFLIISSNFKEPKNYPKTKKYISLFPPEVRNDSAAIASDHGNGGTATEREEVRNTIRERMKKGELNTEPEIHIQDTKSKPKIVGSRTSQSKVSNENERKRVVSDIHDDGFFDSTDSDEE